MAFVPFLVSVLDDLDSAQRHQPGRPPDSPSAASPPFFRLATFAVARSGGGGGIDTGRKQLQQIETTFVMDAGGQRSVPAFGCCAIFLLCVRNGALSGASDGPQITLETHGKNATTVTTETRRCETLSASRTDRVDAGTISGSLYLLSFQKCFSRGGGVGLDGLFGSVAAEAGSNTSDPRPKGRSN